MGLTDWSEKKMQIHSEEVLKNKHEKHGEGFREIWQIKTNPNIVTEKQNHRKPLRYIF